MAREIISAGLDIGSTKIITCIGKFEKGKTDIIGLGYCPNQGMRRGIVVDLEETIPAISNSLEEAERMAQLPIHSAVVGISGSHIESIESKGVIAVSRPDGEISEVDIERVIAAARAIPNKPNRDILHVIPKSFIIDDQEGVRDPIGMIGTRLEVDTLVVSASINAVKSISRCAEQSGLTSNEIIFSLLATSKLLLSKRQMEIGVVLVDIGASSASYAVFEDGDIIFCGVIPIGSSHITNDITIGLRTSLDVAEALKLKHGFAFPDKISEKEEIQLKAFDKKEDGVASLKYISEIVEARLKEILLLIQKDLDEIGRAGALPAGVILTGGGSKIEGIVELAKETLRLPAQVGSTTIDINGLVDKIDDPIYSTSIGLMLWGREKSPSNINSISNNFKGFGKIKDFFKQFLP